MAATIAGAVAADFSSGTSIATSFSGLGTVAQNDLLIVQALDFDFHNASVSGYTALATVTDAASFRLSTWWKLAGSSEAAPTIAYNIGSAGTYMILRVSGPDTTTPINTQTIQQQSSQVSPVTWPSITPSVDGCLIIASIVTRGGNNGFSADTSPAATERLNTTTASATGLFVQEYLQPTAAAIALNATATDDDASILLSLAIKSAAGAGETITVDKWFRPIPDVVRRKIGIVASGTTGVKA